VGCPGRNARYSAGLVFASLFAHCAGAVEPAIAKTTDTGPTLKLSYSQKTFERNPVAVFMYFVPLVATTPVERRTSAGNSQEVAIVSFRRRSSGRTFSASCEFEIRGSGFHRVTFDAPAVIVRQRREFEENATLTSLLDYIQLEGEGQGRIDIIGTIKGSQETVTEVDMRFSMRGKKSPVTIGLYDVAPKDGVYTYENRSNQSVARVNTIVFRKSTSIPVMTVTVASVSKAGAVEGFLARIKGVIANLLIRPPKITVLGNETMLDFGFALLKQEPEFVFPLAQNITQDVTVAQGSPRP